MSSKLAHLFRGSFLCMSLLTGLVIPTQAQSAAPVFASRPALIQSAGALLTDTNVVTLADLGLSEIHLTGPYDSSYFAFGMPADWKLTSGTAITLYLTVALTMGVQGQQTMGQNYTPTAGGGSLTVSINDTTLAVMPLEQLGDTQTTIGIPLSAFTSSRADGRSIVGLVLDARYSCLVFEQMNVIIRTSSSLTLPHDMTQPSTDLVNFPRPIYQNSFVADSALLVIPDKPSAAELQAALTVAAGLGNLSQNNLALDLTTFGKLTPTQTADNHIILIGKAGSLPVLQQLQLPLPVNGGQFQLEAGGQGDGLIEMINSPWSASHNVLVVSGNTDQGTIKAAQALTTGVIRPNRAPNLAVVQ